MGLARGTGTPSDEALARGDAAYLAGRQAGIYPDLDDFARGWALERRFEAAMPADERERRYAGWRDAVRRTLTR